MWFTGNSYTWEETEMDTPDRTAFLLLVDIEQDLRMHVGDGPDREWMVYWLDKIREYREKKYAELQTLIEAKGN
jgi:hypothetical protein